MLEVQQLRKTVKFVKHLGFLFYLFLELASQVKCVIGKLAAGIKKIDCMRKKLPALKTLLPNLVFRQFDYSFLYSAV